MKILITSPTFGAFGGTEAFVFALSNELQRNGVDIAICFKRVKGFKLDHTLEKAVANSKVKVVFVNRASKELFNLIKSADLVHSQNPSIDVAFFAKVLGKLLVTTIYHWKHPGLNLHVLSWSIASSMANRRWYISDFVWDNWEPGKKLSTSGKMPIVSNLPNKTTPYSTREGFVFVGRWIANKGLEVLLEAYRLAEINREAWPLVLAGDGPLRPKIKKEIKKNQIKGVIIKGFVDDNTRNDIISNAKWVVVPPNTKEELGIVPIEARSVKVPCIITRDGGLPEAAGEHCLSCEPNNIKGLKMLLEEAANMGEKEYADLTEASYQELKIYLKPLSVYLKEYKKLLGEKGR